MRFTGLNGRQKAAALLIAMGTEVSAQVFKHLNEEEIEMLTLEIANTRRITPEERHMVLEEFYQMALARDYISQGGIEYARDVLTKALGDDKAIDVINRLTASLQVRPFEFVRKADPTQLLNYLQGEHPQTIALILSFLPPEQGAVIISSLPPEVQSDIAKRIASMERTSPETIREIEKVLEKKLSTLVAQDFTSIDGLETVVQILTRVDRGTERTILESMEIQTPELAEEIKKRMFTFDDIVLLDTRAIQRVLREVDNKDLALALKVANENVKQLIFDSVSKRFAEMLQEDMEYMGPVRLKDVEEAQQKIVGIIRRLEEANEIVYSRGGDQVIV
ncbi:MAG TPA: flagellar motor switch protein FliG [Firmicutes bacterium]|nr:flagellar motor switch protein FliG [Bacillota bacterium]